GLPGGQLTVWRHHLSSVLSWRIAPREAGLGHLARHDGEGQQLAERDEEPKPGDEPDPHLAPLPRDALKEHIGRNAKAALEPACSVPDEQIDSRYAKLRT